MTPAQIIAKALREHVIVHRDLRRGDLADDQDPRWVRCDGPGCDDWTGENTDDHAQHAADMILDALQAGHEIVALPEGVPDDDGQTWFDDHDLRVDHTGRHGATIHLLDRPATAQSLRRGAAEWLAAARDATGEPIPAR
ncbi:hypothetical protein [Prescottella equi]